MVVIKNAHIKTITGPDIDCGQIVIDGSKIVSLGKDVEVPSDATVIDAHGKLVTPGIVEGHCHVGVTQRIGGIATMDHNEKSDPITPQLRISDSFDPFCPDVEEALRSGVTTGVVCPGSSNVIGGSCAAFKLYGTRVDEMILKEPVAIKAAMGENPKRLYGETNKKAPMTRMEIVFLLRNMLTKAKDYMEKKENSEDEVAIDYACEALIPVLKKEIPLDCHAHTSADIFNVIRVAKEFDIRLNIVHGTSSARIAEELAKEGYPIIMGPSLGAISKMELEDKGFDTVPVVFNAGNEIAITTDSPVIPLEYLALCAGLTIKEGLPSDEAWKAITINPAKFHGIDDRVGSIEVGKDADIVIWSNDPLEFISARPEMVIVNGEVAFEK